jgi:hypothetical protein
MTLHGRLAHRKTVIAEQWLDRVLQSYPSRSGIFFKGQGDRFANPVGQTIANGTQAVVEGLLDGAEASALAEQLQGTIEIRAVQEFSPGAALGFIYELKDLLRRELAADLDDEQSRAELRALEQRIDQLMLAAFDRYVACRQRLSEVRVNEIKRSVAVLLRRANVGDDQG